MRAFVLSLLAPLPAVAGTIERELEGLQAHAEILVDRWGVPHIYAQSERDAYFLQGYNAARDRLWQIDLWRRRGLGRLSEVFGKEFVPNDRAARLFLFRGDMDAELAAYGPDGRAAIEAFTSGINAYIDGLEAGSDELPVEFTLTGYAPERWQPQDVVRIRTHGIALNAVSEFQRAQTICHHGVDAEALRVRLQPRWTIQRIDSVDLCDLPMEIISTYGLARRAPLDASTLPRAPGGSNNWAVSAARSSTGRAVLANDPHRTLGLPSMRYLAHVEAPGLRFAGAGEPFVPGVSIGHNGTVAFGLTVQFVDQEDLYVYELHPEDSNRYRYGTGWESFHTVVERISVREADALDVALLFSRHGPVLHIDEEKRRAYGIRSMQLEVGTAPYLGSLNFLKANSAAAAVERLAAWGGPGENMVFGDTTGKIAWQVAAFVPRRPNWDGLLPIPGSGAFEWDGYVRSNDLPGVFDPKSGILVTANEMNFPEDYPYAERKTGFEFVDSARAERIREVLLEEQAVAFDLHLSLQGDVVSIPARDLIRRLRAVEVESDSDRALIDRFDGWDFRMSEDSESAALYAFWMRRTLPASIYAYLIGKPLPPGFAMHMVVLRDIVRDAPKATEGKITEETLDELLLASLRAADGQLSDYQSEEEVGERWGDVQKLELKHPLHTLLKENGYDCLDAYGHPGDGSQHTVDVAYSGPDFHVRAGAAPRIVIDVGAWDNTRFMNLPGQSGDPRSEHYCDQATLWRRGEYVPLLFSRDAIEAAMEQHFRFLPNKE